MFRSIRSLSSGVKKSHFPRCCFITTQCSSFAQQQVDSKCINFALGQPSPSLLPLELLQQCSNDAFAELIEKKDSTILQYGVAEGYLGIRSELARFLSAGNTARALGSISSDNLLITNGISSSLSIVSLCFQSLLGQQSGHSLVYVEEPTYFLAYKIFSEQGLTLDTIPVNENGLDVKYLEECLLDGQRPVFVYTIPFFHNPTGSVMKKPYCEKLIDLAENYNFFIISDEPYNLLNYDHVPLKAMACYDTSKHGRVISLGSFSKILAPGLRLGWAHANPLLINQLKTVGVLESGGGLNPVMSTMVHKVIEHGYLTSHVETLTKELQRRKVKLAKELNKQCKSLRFIEPGGGYFFWVKLPDGMNADTLLHESKNKFGVSFTPGSKCSLKGELSGFIRLSFAFYTCDEIAEGVSRLNNAIQSYK